ncbi:MAG: family 16 glycoside hydrolase [Candidatus Methanomethylicaceae archaeon]
MRGHIFTFSLVVALLAISGCGTNPEVQLVEISKNTVVYDEIVRINNCGGKGDSDHTATREFATTIEFGAGISAGYKSVVEGNIAAKYSEYRTTSKSLRVVAPPGTNMEFVLRWSDDVRAGNVQVNGKSGTYEVRIPVSVEQISSRDLGCGAISAASTTIAPTPAKALPTPPIKGRLLYEDNFDSPSGWNIEEGMAIENGSLIVWPGWDAVPRNPTTYSNFVFESRFYIPQSGSMAFYLRHQIPPCADWNCSIQIALYFDSNTQEIAARRLLGGKPTQQFDIKKARTTFLYPSNWNTIVVQAKGSEYIVYINDVFVFSFTDNAYTSGAYIIDNASNSNGEIRIDYLRFYQIP